MTAHTLYVALPFTRTKEGYFVAGEAKECACAEAAATAAELMTSTSAGAVAFARAIDPAIGTCSTARVLRIVGEVPKLGYLLEAA